MLLSHDHRESFTEFNEFDFEAVLDKKETDK